MTDTIEIPKQKSASWEDIAIFGIGAWLFVSPPTLELNSSPADLFGSVAAGTLTFILAAVSMRKDRLWAEWSLLAWGFILATMPWTLSFTVKAGTINAIACGVIVVALAALRVFNLRTSRPDAPAGTVVPPIPETPETPKAPHDERRAA